MSNPQDYSVGCICALTTEANALRSFLNEEHPGLESIAREDHNAYILGKMGEHNVAIAVLPEESGTASAAGVAKDMLHTFTNLRIGLLVGIGGGAPSKDHDIRLGDVVVSCSTDGYGGVFQYDYGSVMQGGEFQPSAFLDQPPELLRAASAALRADHEFHGHELGENIVSILAKNKRMRKNHSRPDPTLDVLYAPDFTHFSNGICCQRSCYEVGKDEMEKVIKRPPRTEEDDDPTIHYGNIASANSIMKDAKLRDQLAQNFGVLCFETEAAGLMNRFPCLVIRGICDYADTHKYADWRGYAAMTAAAYAKNLISRIAPSKIRDEKVIVSKLSDISECMDQLKIAFWNDRRKQEHDEDLNWLTTTTYSTQQNELVRRRQEGTGEWVLETPQYLSWLAGEGRTLLASGIPGAGKTFIASIAIQHIQQSFRDDISAGIAYIYFDYRQYKMQDAHAVLLSLLKQLAAIPGAFEEDLEPAPENKQSTNGLISERATLLHHLQAIPEALKKLHASHRRDNSRPSMREICSTLEAVAFAYTSVFIVIDALDESPVVDGTREALLESLSGLQERTGINVLITARPTAGIAKHFNQYTQLEVRAQDRDVEKYVKSHVPRIMPFVKGDELFRQTLCQTIISKSNGMFLLAVLYLRSLSGKATKRQVLKTLDCLVSGENDLNSAYEKTLEMIQAQQDSICSVAMCAIAWATFSERLLTIDELKHALAVEVGESELDPNNIVSTEMLLSACRGLIIIQRSANRPGTVHLVHETAERYFKATSAKWFGNPQVRLTETCITYLSFDAFDSGPCESWAQFSERRKRFPFHSYASLNWGYHARLVRHKMRDIILKFLKNESHVAASYEERFTESTSTRPSKIAPNGELGTGLHAAIDFGLHELIQDLLFQGPNRLDVYGRPALQLAIEKRADAVVNELLSAPDLDFNAQDHKGRTPLLLATEFGRVPLVESLLFKNKLLSLPGMKNAASNHPILPRPSINPNAQNELGETSLHIAVKAGKEGIVRLLQQHPDTDFNIQTRFGETALLLSVLYYQVESFNVLLSNPKVDTNISDYRWRTPIVLALSEGREEMSSTLLSRSDINIDPVERVGISPLLAALTAANDFAGETDRGISESLTAKLLSISGIDFHSKDASGRTPLHLAAGCGYQDVVKTLLNGPQVDLNAKTANGQTPLLAAAESGYVNIVRLLLTRKGIDIVHARHPDMVAFSRVGETEQRMIVNMVMPLLPRSTAGKTWVQKFLASAAKTKCRAVFELILQLHDREEEPSRTVGQALLWDAIRSLDESSARLHLDLDYLQFLLEGDCVDVNLKNSSGDTPLIHAIRSWRKAHLAIIFIDAGANVDEKDTHGQTPMFYAREQGDTEMIQLLSSQDANDPIRRSLRMKLTHLIQRIEEQRTWQPRDGG